jgi:hypothetical protein
MVSKTQERYWRKVIICSYSHTPVTLIISPVLSQVARKRPRNSLQSFHIVIECAILFYCSYSIYERFVATSTVEYKSFLSFVSKWKLCSLNPFRTCFGTSYSSLPLYMYLRWQRYIHSFVVTWLYSEKVHSRGNNAKNRRFWWHLWQLRLLDIFIVDIKNVQLECAQRYFKPRPWE